ncbi:unnamed protein product [Rotaria magnacalcarata]|uniref:Uncharacterized protein n=4 Tax=Rotaria magnacalcarata TaxID=392030 RepID=A0A816MZ32_9BILA|nr:unnamed protein product [Rotaria magnacalcarata]CAF2271110.1 unnamed protein product [Rotaria magnacalcarata]CAF3943838.1 unnamed protein product [Rotaria magnacalcarata]
MQYSKKNENVAAIASPGIMVSQPLPLNKDPEIRETRKLILLILGVCIALSVFGTTGSKYSGRQAGIGQSLASLLLYSFAYLVTYRYSSTGLRAFAWISIFGLVSTGIGLVVLMIFDFLTLTASTANANGQLILAGLSLDLLFLVIISIIAFVLQIMIIKLAFKLARLIGAKKSLFFQQL